MQSAGTHLRQAAGRGTPLRAVPRGTAARTVPASPYADILERVLPPGAGLEEAGPVRGDGLSHTPVREALNQLAAEGLMQTEDFGHSIVQHEAIIAALCDRDAEPADAPIHLPWAVFRGRIASLVIASAAGSIPLDAPPAAPAPAIASARRGV
jgi:hypothetical protein